MNGGLNCWEFNKCGRETGGTKVGENGVCAAACTVSCSGINSGVNAGRMCWAVAGTFSTGRITGTYSREFSCLNCDFLKTVCKDEHICSIDQLTPYRLYNQPSLMFGRRSFMRIDAFLDITLNPEWRRSYIGIVGVTVNFCREGFAFISENFELPSTRQMEFKIKLPNSGRYTRVAGEIAWKRQFSDRCMAGVAIIDIEEEAEKEILDYAYGKWVRGVWFHRPL
ncbi:MAG: PilZ domain-containing protein [Nitrospirota bacterium]